jgi:two-component system, cell cycle response regulator DivK
MTNKKILYVEDDSASLLFIKRLLTKHYEFDSAQSDSDAVQKLKENDYDLVLMDINLGGELDGVEIMKLARDFKPELKTIFIALTTQANFTGQDNFTKHGFNGYFEKPLDIDSLVSSIDFLLKK